MIGISMQTYLSEKPSIFEQLLKELVEISAAPSGKAHELLKIYDYLANLFVANDDSSTDECQHFVYMFETSLVPILFSEGYYSILAEKFEVLENILQKKAEQGKPA